MSRRSISSKIETRISTRFFEEKWSNRIHRNKKNSSDNHDKIVNTSRNNKAHSPSPQAAMKISMALKNLKQKKNILDHAKRINR